MKPIGVGVKSSNFRNDVAKGERFEFGKNWSMFLRLIDNERICDATESLQQMLEFERLDGLSFLDVGSGSGLFSLAARRLGAKVHSFDYDPASVGCTKELKRRYYESDPEWNIEEASVLDHEFMASLKRFDIVYAWGSLHHTGSMWEAIELTARRVATGGVLYLSIYPDRGWVSIVWRAIKRLYCSSLVGKTVVLTVFIPYFAIRGLIEDLWMLQNPIRRYADYRKTARGMSVLYDSIDWLGGYPYEFAKPDELIRFCGARGLVLQRQRHTEYVFRKSSLPS